MCSTRVTTAFNNAGGCRNTRLFLGNVSNSNDDQQNSNSIPLCGEMQTWLVGVNWWMTEYVRLMFQYSESDLSNYPFFVPELCRFTAWQKQWLRRRKYQRVWNVHARRLVSRS